MRANVKDGLEWARKLTPRKVANAGRILGSYQRGKLLRYPSISGMPIGLSFEPTTACNLRCPECPSGLRAFTRPTGTLKDDLFHRVIDELAPTLWFLTFYFQGEPFIDPGFLKKVEYASRKGIYTATSTNAHFLDDAKAEATVRSGLSRLIISLDGTDQQTYAAYRKEGSLEQVLNGAENIVRWKKKLNSRTPHVVFQFLVVRPNEHQIEDARAMAKKIGVDDIWFKTAQVYDPGDDHPLIPKQEKYSRYRRSADGTWKLKNALADHCWKMWHSCVITWDGKVVPCCFDKDAHHVLGEVGSTSFRDVWNSAAYRQFRGALLNSRSNFEMCSNCSEGTKVWA